MSVFDFPRINIKGIVQINVGTGNNDDYSLSVVNPASGTSAATYTGTSTIPPAPGVLGQSLRLANSATVLPYDFNGNDGNPMTDDQLIAWASNPQNFANYPPASKGGGVVGNYTVTPFIPGEWNYYGTHGVNMINTAVVGVAVPGPSGSTVYQQNDPFGLIGGTLSFNNRPDSTGRSTAMMIDVTPEGATCSQIFSENLMLQVGQNVIFNGMPTKAITRWINFQRNTVLGGPNGASGTFQCVVPLSALQGQSIVNIMQQYPVAGKTLKGIVFRYTLFRSLQNISTQKYPGQAWFDQIQTLYQNNGINPSNCQISGTIAPWYDGDMESVQTGSYLVPQGSFTSPGGNAGPPPNNFQLAPAIVNWSGGNPLVSIDMTAALPDNYNDPDFDPMNQGTNPKFDLGPLNFGSLLGSLYTPIGAINYTNTTDGDAAGWIFDYSVPDINSLRVSQKQGEAIIWPQFVVQSQQASPNTYLLQEEQLFIVSDQGGVYAEMGLTPANPSWQTMPALPNTSSTFCYNAYMDTQISFNVFKWGQPYNGDLYDIWMWNITYPVPPAVYPNPVQIMSNYVAGQPITVPTDTAGVFILIMCQIGNSMQDVINNYNPNGNPIAIPMINIRILPNMEMDDLFTFDATGNPVATANMDWDALYSNVFRNYYVLYPGMSQIIPLNQPDQWVGPTLFTLLERVDTSAWGTFSNMPRVRDLSATRRWLVQAYCNKFASASPATNAPFHPIA